MSKWTKGKGKVGGDEDWGKTNFVFLDQEERGKRIAKTMKEARNYLQQLKDVLDKKQEEGRSVGIVLDIEADYVDPRLKD